MNRSPAALTVHLQCVILGFMRGFILEVCDCFDSKWPVMWFLCVCDHIWHFLTCVCWVALGKTSWGSDYKIPSLKEKKMEGSRGESWRQRQSKGRERSGKGHTCARTLPDAGVLPPNFVHFSFPFSLVTMVEISAGVRGEIVCDGWTQRMDEAWWTAELMTTDSRIYAHLLFCASKTLTKCEQK